MLKNFIICIIFAVNFIVELMAIDLHTAHPSTKTAIIIWITALICIWFVMANFRPKDKKENKNKKNRKVVD